MKPIKYGAFILLTIVSAYLSVNMFISLGADFIGKLVLGLVALALESTKVFSLLRIEYSMYLRAVKEKVKLPLNSIAIYFFLATLSVVASLGFTLVTVDKQVESSKAVFTTAADDYTFDIEQKQASLALIDSQILALQKQMGGINPDYATGSVKLSTEAQNLANKREALINEISSLKKQQREAVVAVAQSEKNNVYGMFVLMGNAIGGMPEKTVMFILLFLISILIEVGMIYTSPTIEVKGEDVHEVIKSAAVPQKIEKQSTPSQKEQQKKLAAVQANRKAFIREKPSVELKPFDPHITTEQVQVNPHKREIYDENPVRTFLQKLLTPIKGTELKPASAIADETHLPVEKINEVLAKISRLRSNTNSPLLVQKDTAWHLSYMKDLTISAILKSESMINYLKGILNVS